jgi:WD40 repeat protein
MAVSPDGKLVATADDDGAVRLWDPATGRADGAPLQTGSGNQTPPNGMAFSPNAKLVAIADGADNTVRLWDLVTGRPAGTIGAAFANAVAFSRDGKLLAILDSQGTIQLWDPVAGHAAGAPLQIPPVPQTGGVSSQSLNAVAFSPDGKLLAIANGDGTVQLWTRVTGHALGGPLHVTSPKYGVNQVAFSPDGRLLASADGDGTVRLWDPVTGQAVGGPLHASSKYGVNQVAFSPDGKLLASADGDGTVRLWDPVTGQGVGGPLNATSPLPGVFQVAFSPDGKLLASVDGDGTVRMWKVSLFANPYAALCADVGPPNRQDWNQYASGEPEPKVCS